MKSCDEMAKDVFRRIEEHNENRKKKVKKAVSVMIPAVSFCVAIAVGAGVWMLKGNTPGVEIKDPPDSATVSSNLENSDAVTSKPKEYTSFEAEAYYETMLKEGEQELKGTAYHNPKLTRKLLKETPEDLAKTVTRTVFGVEQEYTLRLAHENEYLNLNIGTYRSSQGQVLEIHPDTGEILSYRYIGETIGKEGKQRISDEELIEKAAEYLAEFTDEDITRYSREIMRGNDNYSHRVSFTMTKNGVSVYTVYTIVMDYSGEFWYYVASDCNGYREIEEFSEDALKQVEAAAETAMMDVCEKNGISFSETSKINASMYYSAEDSCPIINFAYTVPVSVDGETKERTIVVQVKAK